MIWHSLLSVGSANGGLISLELIVSFHASVRDLGHGRQVLVLRASVLRDNGLLLRVSEHQELLLLVC